MLIVARICLLLVWFFTQVVLSVNYLRSNSVNISSSICPACSVFSCSVSSMAGGRSMQYPLLSPDSSRGSNT